MMIYCSLASSDIFTSSVLQSDETALYKAAQYGKLKVVELLLISGADPFIKAKVSVNIASCYLLFYRWSLNNDFDCVG